MKKDLQDLMMLLTHFSAKRISADFLLEKTETGWTF